MDQFSPQIFAVIHQIPYGKVTTYGDIARFSGFPGYARHVGKALGSLPEGSKLPWYRVINSKGELTLKGDSLDRQKKHLVEEGIEVSDAGRVKLKIYKWQP